MIDTGATPCVISKRMVKDFGWLNKITSCRHELNVADNRTMVVTE